MARRTALWWVSVLLTVPGIALAHDFRAGALRIDHPYATPSRLGMTTGAVYFRGIRNGGNVADRLLSASTPVATSVEVHRMQMLQGDVVQMRAVPALDIPAGTTLVLKHSKPDGYHLMLFGLQTPLKDGDRFPITLHFERAGVHTVQVWVQTPRRKASVHQHH
jgi:periplasmic copper chaperone A